MGNTREWGFARWRRLIAFPTKIRASDLTAPYVSATKGENDQPCVLQPALYFLSFSDVARSSLLVRDNFETEAEAAALLARLPETTVKSTPVSMPGSQLWTSTSAGLNSGASGRHRSFSTTVPELVTISATTSLKAVCPLPMAPDRMHCTAWWPVLSATNLQCAHHCEREHR